MNYLKKSVCLIAVLAVIFSMCGALAGCDNKAGENTQAGTTVPGATQPAATQPGVTSLPAIWRSTRLP